MGVIIEDRSTMDNSIFDRRLISGPILMALSMLMAIGLSLVPQSAGADEELTRWSTSLRWGLEVDDNPERLEGYQGPSDLLTRYLLGADIVTEIDPSGQVSATIRHGGTLFHRQQDASAILTQINGQGSLRVNPHLVLMALVDVKDRSERQSERDYNRGGASMRAVAMMGDFQLWAGPGWRYFAFKPAPASSNRGPRLQSGARWAVRNDLSLDASWAHIWRDYSSPAWEIRDDHFVPVADGVERSDRYQVWQIGARYQRHLNARLDYRFAHNRSNSFGKGLRRHSLEATMTLPLFWEVFASARLEVQRTRYEDPVLIDEIFILDEENRNNLALALARSIGQRWEVELRYNLFAQEFGIDGRYRRHTILMGIGFFLDGSS